MRFTVSSAKYLRPGAATYAELRARWSCYMKPTIHLLNLRSNGQGHSCYRRWDHLRRRYFQSGIRLRQWRNKHLSSLKRERIRGGISCLELCRRTGTTYSCRFHSRRRSRLFRRDQLEGAWSQTRHNYSTWRYARATSPHDPVPVQGWLAKEFPLPEFERFSCTASWCEQEGLAYTELELHLQQREETR